MQNRELGIQKTGYFLGIDEMDDEAKIELNQKAIAELGLKKKELSKDDYEKWRDGIEE